MRLEQVCIPLSCSEFHLLLTSPNSLGRPIAGHANFNASNLIDNPLDLPRQAGIAVHEISHALGFSSSRWNSGTFIKYLVNGSGTKYPFPPRSILIFFG